MNVLGAAGSHKNLVTVGDPLKGEGGKEVGTGLGLIRKDLGNVIQAYQEVARRLGIMHEEANISEVQFGKPKAVNLKKK